MTPEEIRAMPSGRVLKRDGKHKLRVVRPAHLNTCDICHEGVEGNMCKWEKGGNITLLSLCPDCAIDELLSEVKRAR